MALFGNHLLDGHSAEMRARIKRLDRRFDALERIDYLVRVPKVQPDAAGVGFVSQRQ